MKVKICFYTEMEMVGKIPDDFSNMRTEFAWMNTLNATHIPLRNLCAQEGLDNQFDLGIFIIPKNVDNIFNIDIVSLARLQCKKVAFMQEGPSWYFQSLDIQKMFWFHSVMQSCDFCLAHNQIDADYYEGLLNIKCYINPTLMVDTPLKELIIKKSNQRNHIMIGGNLGNWYGGFNSLIAASSSIPDGREDEFQLWMPSMGKMSKMETYIEGLNHLPYVDWKNWIYSLNNFKYAIHLNPNNIGGTFSLNCAYLGIPCIGNIETNTQRLCFPDLSVKSTDIKGAVQLLRELINNEDFYSKIIEKAKVQYQWYFSKDAYISNWRKIVQDIFKI